MSQQTPPARDTPICAAHEFGEWLRVLRADRSFWTALINIVASWCAVAGTCAEFITGRV